MEDARDVAHGRLDRRRLLRSGAVVGTVVWATPVLQTISSPAFAAGSPLCETRVRVKNCTQTFVPSVDCCECLESHPELSLAEALALCAREGRCALDLETCGEEDENPPPDEQPPPPDVAGDEDQPDVPTVIPAGS